MQLPQQEATRQRTQPQDDVGTGPLRSRHNLDHREALPIFLQRYLRFQLHKTVGHAAINAKLKQNTVAGTDAFRISDRLT